eukprot:g1037.t1
MLKLHKKDDGAFVLTQLCELDLGNQIIEFVDVLECYYEGFLFGHHVLAEEAETQLAEHPAVAIWHAMMMQGPLNRELCTSCSTSGSAPCRQSQCRFRYTSHLNLLDRGQGLWSLLGYALAAGRDLPGRTLLRAGASPLLLRESAFDEHKSPRQVTLRDPTLYFHECDARYWVEEIHVNLSSFVGNFLREQVHPGYTATILRTLFDSICAEGDGYFIRGSSCGCTFSEVQFWLHFCRWENRVDNACVCPVCAAELTPSSPPRVSAEESLARFHALAADKKTMSSDGNEMVKQHGRVLLSRTETKKLDPGHTQEERLRRVGEALSNRDLFRLECLYDLGVDFTRPVTDCGLTALELLASGSPTWNKCCSRATRDLRAARDVHLAEYVLAGGVHGKLPAQKLEYALQLARYSGNWAVAGVLKRTHKDKHYGAEAGCYAGTDACSGGSGSAAADFCFDRWRTHQLQLSPPYLLRSRQLRLPEHIRRSVAYGAFYIDNAFTHDFLNTLIKHYFQEEQNEHAASDLCWRFLANDRVAVLEQESLHLAPDRDRGEIGAAADSTDFQSPSEQGAEAAGGGGHTSEKSDDRPRMLSGEQSYLVAERSTLARTGAKQKKKSSRAGGKATRARNTVEPQRKAFADLTRVVRQTLRPSVEEYLRRHHDSHTSPCALFYPQMRFLHYDRKDKAAAAHTDLSRTVDMNSLLEEDNFDEDSDGVDSDSGFCDAVCETTTSVQPALLRPNGHLTSTHTFVLYLNSMQARGDDVSGSTRILSSICEEKEKNKDQKSHCLAAPTVKMRPPLSQSRVLETVLPMRGRLLLFPHDCPHEGFPVCREQKLLLRGEAFLGSQ